MKLFWKAYLIFFIIYAIPMFWFFFSELNNFGPSIALTDSWSSFIIFLVGIYASLKRQMWVVIILMLYGFYLWINPPYVFLDPINKFFGALTQLNFQFALVLFAYYFIAIISAVGLFIWWREKRA